MREWIRRSARWLISPWGATLLVTLAWCAYMAPRLSGVSMGGPDMHVIVGNLRADHSLAAVWSWFTGPWVQGPEYYRPLSSLLHWMDFMLWGDEAPGWGLTNTLIVAASLIALTWLCAEGLRLPWAGPVAGIALLRLEPVEKMPLWPAWRTDALAGLFLLIATAAALSYLRGGSRGRLWLALAMLLLALMSKEVALAWPGVAAIIVLMMARNRRGLVLLGSVFVLTGVFWVMRASFLGQPLGPAVGAQAGFPVRMQLMALVRTMLDPVYIHARASYPMLLDDPSWWTVWGLRETIMQDAAFIAANVVVGVMAPRLLGLIWSWRLITYLPALPFARLWPFYYYVPSLGTALLYGVAAALAARALRPRLSEWWRANADTDDATEAHQDA
ncbi:MAG: hypothetical protein ACOX9R_01810 [Armatimonadota bacterium]|jgi:hypothetical protein